MVQSSPFITDSINLTVMERRHNISLFSVTLTPVCNSVLSTRGSSLYWFKDKLFPVVFIHLFLCNAYSTDAMSMRVTMEMPPKTAFVTVSETSAPLIILSVIWSQNAEKGYLSLPLVSFKVSSKIFNLTGLKRLSFTYLPTAVSQLVFLQLLR